VVVDAALGTGERYPAGWRFGEGAPASGVLVLEPNGFRLEGRREGEDFAETITYGTIDSVRIGRVAAERIDGRRTIVLERRDADRLLIEPHGLGLLTELADALSALTARAAVTAALNVIVPLRPGAAAKARELLEAGPPFDPETLGLTEHWVAVTEKEVVFSFSGHGVRSLLEHGARDPSLWRAGLAWRSLIAGKPRVAETVFTWHS
jgi:hypothetical protein